MEIELKLALPGCAPPDLVGRLGQLPMLKRRNPVQQTLRNIYYDTAEQALRSKQVALRVRRVKGPGKAVWIQTLKTGGAASALSQRGEWECALPNGRLSLKALLVTPWPQIDPDGDLFPALGPRFETSFERTLWLLRRRGGSEIEVALDIGVINAAERSMPICELELELRAGPASALFEVAGQVAKVIALLPLSASKAERGHALAEGRQDQPRRAQPGVASRSQALPDIAREVLRETFGQFSANLEMLLRGDAAEQAHQARVGWRRFRSAVRLFRPFIALDAAPSWQPLRSLLTPLGELRDLDVARAETLPPLAQAFVAGSEDRAARWKAVQRALDDQARQRLQALRAALGSPEVGACLLETSQWVELFDVAPIDKTALAPAAQSWARRKLGGLHARMVDAARDPGDADLQHRARILAKRLRYGIEELRSLLPKRQASRWHAQACALQESLGAERDMAQALSLVLSRQLDTGVADYLRGVAAGQGAWANKRLKPQAK